MKKNFTIQNLYYIFTAIIAILVGIMGGVIDILQTDGVKDVSIVLGYPLYFFFLLGIFKISGAIILFLPNKFSRIKDIVYAGFAIDFIFASYSHFSVGDPFGKIVIPLIFLIILAISFLLNEKLRTQNT
jgi:hypothetical protein